MWDEPGLRSGALTAGAADYLLKDAPPTVLIEAIHRAAAPALPN